jgi:phosphoglycolate phosphatase
MATRTVVFDMDGTLVQTRAASWEVFQDTAREYELPIRSAEEFFELFRGNFYESLETLCGDPAVYVAVREHFLQGLRERYSPAFIPGMRDVVKALAAHYPLAVMSSNAMGAIRRILENEGLAHCFAHVFAGDAGASKEQQLQQILDEPSYGSARHCSPNYVEGDLDTAAEVVLITDTVGDVREARSCGVRAIGVSWGMHSSEALLNAGAECVAMWPQELVTTLLPVPSSNTDRTADAEGTSCGCATQAGSCSPAPAGAADAARVAHPSGPTPSNSSWAAASTAGRQRQRRRAAVVDGSSAIRAPRTTAPPTTTGIAAPGSAVARAGSTRTATDADLKSALHRIAPHADQFTAAGTHGSSNVRPPGDRRRE